MKINLTEKEIGTIIHEIENGLYSGDCEMTPYTAKLMKKLHKVLDEPKGKSMEMEAHKTASKMARGLKVNDKGEFVRV